MPWADAIFSLWWLATNALLLGLAAKVTARLFPGSRFGSRILHVTVLFVAEVTAITTFLGALGLISGPTLLAGAGLFGAVVWLVLSSRAQGAPLSDRARSLLPAGWALAKLSWLWFWGLAAGTLLVQVVVMGLFRFPEDFDCLMYHMPLMNLWIQHGSLYAPEFGANWFLAANNEVLALWMTAPFSGDFLAALNNVPALIIWATALFQLGRQFGLRRWWPHLTTFLTMLMLTVDQQYNNMSNDLPVAAFFVAGASYSLRYVKTLEPASLWLAGLCIGLLAGVKYFALGYASVLIATTVTASLVVRGPRAAARAVAVFALTGPVLGGYWYLRNWIVTGVPLYPMGFQGPTEVLGYPGVWSTTLAGNGDPRVLEYTLAAIWQISGPWHLLAVLLAPATFVSLLAPTAKRVNAAKGRLSIRTSRRMLLLLLAGSFAVWIVTPYAVEDQPGTLNHLGWAFTPVRYGLCFLSLASITLGLCLKNISHLAGRRLGIPVTADRSALLALALVAAWQADRTLSLTVSLDLLALGFDVAILTLLSIFIYRTYPRTTLTVGTALLAVAVPITTAFLSGHWHGGLAKHFDERFGAAIFERLARSSENQHVFVLGNQPYPFFGSRRQHRVVCPRFAPTPARLPEYLKTYNIALIAVQRNPEGPVDRYRGASSLIASAPADILEIEIGAEWKVFRVGSAPPFPAKNPIAGASNPSKGKPDVIRSNFDSADLKRVQREDLTLSRTEDGGPSSFIEAGRFSIAPTIHASSSLESSRNLQPPAAPNQEEMGAGRYPSIDGGTHASCILE